MCGNNILNISIGIIALNEEMNLPSLLDDLLKQSYDKKKIEIIFVDALSDDSTYKLFTDFRAKYIKVYKNIKIYKNNKKIQAAGWNIVIKNFEGDALIRIDAHSRLQENFIENNVCCLSKGEKIVGGARPTILAKATKWNNTLLLAEESLFGSSIASYRRSNEERYVKSMFHACYVKEVVKSVGLFNEYLGRTEDNEYHFRIRQLGYKLFYSPTIKSYQIIRSNLKKMLKQKYGNGYWIGRTLIVCPRCLSIFHLIPLCFTIALVSAVLLATIKIKFILILLLSLYLIFDVLNTLFCFRNEKANITSILLLFIFPLLHISYGIGTFVGIVTAPFWKDIKKAEFKIRRI